ncbi:MAG TPA: Rieske 2Fe-2S domain-containing protein [Candidatus Limnocylindrales bacterium]|nr:Rieske 2Fe-2S domain-containing protein [Candidatus Limnocylindrales bacterium]
MLVRLLTRLIDGQRGWAVPLGDLLHRILAAVFRPVPWLRDFLNGRWLGHPLHAAMTDVPVGALTVSLVLDLLDQRAAADVALLVGVLAIAASAVTGLADFSDTDGTPRLRATVHLVVMVAAQLLFAVSLLLRLGAPADRTLPIVLSLLAYLLLTAGAWIGGDVVYLLGNMVNRHAWRSRGAKWQPLDVGELPEGQPVKATAGMQTLVLVRSGERIDALHETCAHAGGPLSAGRIVDGCIECPWHGSRFRLSDGTPVRGPAVYAQPVYEVRAAEGGGYEARRLA